MAGPPLTGNWAAINANAAQMAGARKWGTGYNPVHEVYGQGPPLGVTGRTPGPDEPGPESDYLDVPGELLDPEMFGYTMEDVGPLTEFPGMPPSVGTDTEIIRGNAQDHPPWGPRLPSGGTIFRGISEGANVSRHTPVSFPTETVTEGWEHKTAGPVEDAGTSGQGQYERQTSMQQVNPPAGRNNALAVARGTDDPRENILTRLTGMKLKPWSTGERLQDMFPFQQDTMLRPFWYRTAGTGDPQDMAANDMYVSLPIQREPPTDPYMGPTETDAMVLANDYGYSGEDGTYV